MPKAWSNKDERQYEHIKDSMLDDGRSERKAKEIAARTVNKTRRKAGRTPNKTSQGTGNPNTSLEDRTVVELRNIAASLKVPRQSQMRKADLIVAIRQAR